MKIAAASPLFFFLNEGFFVNHLLAEAVETHFLKPFCQVMMRLSLGAWIRE